MKVSLTNRAQAEQDAIFDYLAARSPSGARNWAVAIERALVLIGEHPESGSRTRRPGTRSIGLAAYPYRIFYRVTARDILIQHIRHTSRRPSSRLTGAP